MATRTVDTKVPLDALLLDPNNYRFQDADDFVWADETRFSEPTVQERAFSKLRAEGLTELKNSIMANGFLDFERIVVQAYAPVEGLYVVIEGNRRVAALRWIKSDFQAGVSLPEALQEVLDAVPVTVLEADPDDPTVRLSLMGIRHVGGIREWVRTSAPSLSPSYETTSTSTPAM